MARLTLGYLFHLPVDCHLSRRRKGWRDMAAATGAGGCQIEVHPVPGLPRPAPVQGQQQGEDRHARAWAR